MRITLSNDQQAALLTWSRQHVEREVRAGLEPSGYTLCVAMSCMPSANAEWGADRLELGDVDVELT